MSDQKSYSFEFKMEVLREIEERKGEKNSKLAIAKKYSIPASTLATFLKNYNKTAVLEAEPMDIMGIIKNIKCLLYSQELFLLNSQILNKKNVKKKQFFKFAQFGETVTFFINFFIYFFAFNKNFG